MRTAQQRKKNTFCCTQCNRGEKDWYEDGHGYRYCARCFEVMFCVCYSCSRIIERANVLYDENGDPLCQECRAERR